MTEAQKILEMIKVVSPDDTVAMDEIDARMEAYLADKEYSSHGHKEAPPDLYVRFKSGDGGWIRRYTRSRDALKAIRPEGWTFVLRCYVPKGHTHAEIYDCSMLRGIEAERGAAPEVKGFGLPTEELAEIHAIIQAIEYERTAK